MLLLTMPDGYLVLALHAHLPYVLSHGKWPHGSDWLCEAACETYLPLLNMLNQLTVEGKRSRFTLGITPVLCEMLAAPRFPSLLKEYMGEKIAAAAYDRFAFHEAREQASELLAARWVDFYAARLQDFTMTYRQDLLGAFRKLQEEGRIELIGSAATHAYLPLLGLDSSISAQITQGMATYRKYFARQPGGMWLPECAYRPATRHRRGLEAFLAAHGLRYFFVDGYHVLDKRGPGSYGVEMGRELSLRERGRRSGAYGERFTGPGSPGEPSGTEGEAPWTEGWDALYRVHRTGSPGSGDVAFFARDTDTSQQVWNARWGYPGDPYYLEFHKKHSPGGLRYWRVTDREADLGTKLLYEPDRAAGRIQAHARHFASVVSATLGRYRAETGSAGVLTLPFDAELFGHWWFEGIDWLHTLVSVFEENYGTIETATASEALKHAVENGAGTAPLGTITLHEGSWGEGGRHATWYNKETAWTWECAREAERSMAQAVRGTRKDRFSSRILKQMARELFLLQSSDWQFLISTKTAGDYGASRFRDHYNAFKTLQRALADYEKGKILSGADEEALSALEEKDAVFDNVRPEWFE